DFEGMGKQSPVMALTLTLALVSLAGFPPTAGFLAKFYLFNSAINHDLLWLVIIAVINSTISAYYYLRVVKLMWLREPKTTGNVGSSTALKVSLALSSFSILALGIFPRYAIQLVEAAAKIFKL
ncbi:MAG: proton-conducting transporter membrane subunit, partial [Chloroflexi bacterium]|nr:proton-conducting transporter membrane subunit [Chloroflexota bacterium]